MTTSTHESILKRIGRYRLLWLVITCVFFLDLASKSWILEHVPAYGAPIPVVDSILYIVHVYNTGGAWSILAGYSDWLVTFGFVALAILFAMRKHLELDKSIQQWIFGLIVGGILGNLWDRIVYGHVIDFIDVHLPFYRWPAFNVADIGISVGVLLYCCLLFKYKKAIE
jgi:signal peptidase II